jgi:hypothetical protein
MTHSARLASALLVGLTLLGVSGAAQTAPNTRTIFVSAFDKKGPVSGLTAADFVVKEDGKPREVVRAEVALTPLHIALLVDDDDQGGKAIRTGLAGFVQKMAGHAQIALVSTRGGPVVRQEFSTDTNAILAAINAMPLVNPGQAYLPSGLVDLSRAMAQRSAARPVIVAIASPGLTVNTTEDGPDGPVPATKTIGAQVSPSSAAPALALDAIRRTHTTLFLLHLDTYSARSVDNQPPEVHYSWPLDGPPQSGGRTERIVTPQGLVAALDRVAEELLGQYAVTYASTDASGTPALSVDLKRKGVTVHAPQRLY